MAGLADAPALVSTARRRRQIPDRELADALDAQAATSEILRVIACSPADTQPVFETIAAAALKLCGARSANVFTYDGQLLHIAALAIVDPKGIDAMRSIFPRPASRDSAACRAILTRDVVAIPDVLEDPDFVTRQAAVAAGFRSSVAVPLMRDGSPIGAIAVGRVEAGTMPPRQIALLQTFADQAVIAIENVRLFKETKEALERQTATAEVLRVISGSITDTQPVFDVIAERAARLTGADYGMVFSFDGEWIQVASTFGVNAEGVAATRNAFPMRPGLGSVTAQAIRDAAVVNVADVLALSDTEYLTHQVARSTGYRGLLSVPMLRDGQVVGAITVMHPQAGLFAANQVDLLESFASQAVIAIENVRLFKALQARTTELTRSVEQLGALSEVGQAVSSTLDLETVLSTIVSRATALADMDGGAIYEYEEAREVFRLHAADRLPDELVEALRSAPPPKGEGAIGRLATQREPVAISDILDQDAYQSRVRETLLRLGYRSLLALPLLYEGRLLGGLVVNRKRTGAFEPRVVELLQTFATQSALAIQNARLFREVEHKSRQLEAASRHKSAFLANMSHELRTPLNAIIGFTRIVMRRTREQIEVKQVENLDKILASAQHLLGLINATLDLAKIEAGHIEIDATEIDLGPLLDDCARSVEPLLDAAVTLTTATGDDLPQLTVDADKLRQIMLNLLSNAVKFTARGRIDVLAHCAGGRVEISVADTGIGIPADKLETVFEEFEQVDASITRAHGGSGLGLSIARHLARLMGGELRAQSTLGAGSTFTLSLPLRFRPATP